jgi:hypothetical protein
VEKREREAHEKAEKQRLAKEEAERIAAEKKKKKPVRYPTEDLDIRISDKDKKAGLRLTRPLANRACLPFNDVPGAFEAFLMAWNFLVVYGSVIFLHLLRSATDPSPAHPFIYQFSPLTNLRMLFDTPPLTNLAHSSPKSIRR